MCANIWPQQDIRWVIDFELWVYSICSTLVDPWPYHLANKKWPRWIDSTTLPEMWISASQTDDGSRRSTLRTNVFQQTQTHIKALDERVKEKEKMKDKKSKCISVCVWKVVKALYFSSLKRTLSKLGLTGRHSSYEILFIWIHILGCTLYIILNRLKKQ